MLRPIENATRERKSLNGIWRFTADPDCLGQAARWWTRDLPGWRDMPVPASFNDIYPEAALRDHVGDAWYQTELRIPRGWAGQRIVLRFDAATHCVLRCGWMTPRSCATMAATHRSRRM